MTVSTRIAAQAQQECEALLQDIDSAQAVVLATPDGFAVAHAHRGAVHPSRIAAITSSISAIGSAVTQEAHLGRARCLIVDAEDGFVVVRTVHGGDAPLIVNVLAGRSATLGYILSRVGDTCRRLEAA